MTESKDAKENKRYALYVRVSTEEQAQAKEGSLTSQLQRLTEYLQLKSPNSPYLVYKEEGKSAKDTNRPQYQRLMQHIAEGKIHTVLCTELSRISRSSIDFLNFIQFCNKHKIEFICLKEQFDTTASFGKAMMTICMALAQFEREQISERTSTNMQARRRRGLFNGGFFYGYVPRHGKKGYLDIDDHENYVVALIYTKYAVMQSAEQVAEWLNSEGLQTKEYTSRQGRFHPAKKWNKKNVLSILQNPRYMGKIEDNGKLIDAVWEPMISEELWNGVQKILKQNRRAKKNRNGHVYVLSNLYCVHCDTKLEKSAGTSRNKTVHFYYRHPPKTRKQDCFYPVSLPAAKLETFVCKEIQHKLEDDDLVTKIVDQTTEKLAKETKELKNRLQEIEKQITSLDNERDGIIKKMGYIAGNLINEFITPHLNKISEQSHVLLERKMELETELENIKSEYFLPDDLRMMIYTVVKKIDLLEDKEKQRLLDELIERVELRDGEMRVYLAENRGGNRKDSCKPGSGSYESQLAPRDGLYVNRFLGFKVASICNNFQGSVDFSSARK